MWNPHGNCDKERSPSIPVELTSSLRPAALTKFPGNPLPSLLLDQSLQILKEHIALFPPQSCLCHYLHILRELVPVLGLLSLPLVGFADATLSHGGMIAKYLEPSFPAEEVWGAIGGPESRTTISIVSCARRSRTMASRAKKSAAYGMLSLGFINLISLSLW